MKKEQLVEFVNRLKKAGVNISITKPRSKINFQLGKGDEVTSTN